MKTIRGMIVPVVVVLALLALTPTGARAQRLHSTLFSGEFTLPFEVQWGAVTLPAGEYSLRYGRLNNGGIYTVAIVGKSQGSPYGWVLPEGANPTSATKNTLICIREGNKGYIRELRLGFIGQSAQFTVPHGVVVRARIVAEGKRSANTQLTEVRIPIAHVPVK
jgi:hypothetical protein